MCGFLFWVDRRGGFSEQVANRAQLDGDCCIYICSFECVN